MEVDDRARAHLRCATQGCWQAAAEHGTTATLSPHLSETQRGTNGQCDRQPLARRGAAAICPAQRAALERVRDRDILMAASIMRHAQLAR
jgi:hypothetical protein